MMDNHRDILQRGHGAEACRDASRHTDKGVGCMDFHEWAEKKAKTHEQRRCLVCGFWVMWVKKTPARRTGRSKQ